MTMIDLDHAVALGVRASVKASRLAPAAWGPHATWRRGQRLSMLFVGYNGAGNVGADARVAAMARQFEAVLGEQGVEISVLTQETEHFRRYVDPRVGLVRIDPIFFGSVLRACSASHLAVLSEGSALKSNLANALTLLFCEAAGVMKAQRKPCIAYGCDAGRMDDFVRTLAADLCSETYFLARAEPSLAAARELGLRGHVGTDPAWTFPEKGGGWAEARLAEVGWDGRRPLIGAAVTNPFRWPVKPSLARLLRAAARGDWEDHYRRWYFFSSTDEGRRRFDAYLRAVAAVLDNVARRHGAVVLILGLDARDLDACRRLQLRVSSPSEIFSAHQYDGYELCAVLRRLSVLLTSDYHGRILSMPAGVPAIALSIDERLLNLYEETGQRGELYFEAGEEGLAEKLDGAVERALREGERITAETLAFMPRALESLGRMGLFMRRYVEESFPGIALGPAPRTWQDALGPVEPRLERFLV
jgi:polysaccharide pyruvyl transferase WcaK-like protein